MGNNTVKSPGKAAPRKALKFLAKLHVFINKWSGGLLWNTMEGNEVCFVTMTGAKSGRQITIPVLHLPYKSGVLLVASQTGRDTNPLWYKNIVKTPDIKVRHRGNTLELRARDATKEEKEDLWPICDALYSDFALYRARTTRDIPILVCESV